MVESLVASCLASTAAVVVAIELHGRPRPQWLDNVGLGVARGLFELATRGLQLGAYEAVQRAAGLPALDALAPATWLVALFGYDFLYYWAHRTHHRVGLLWATHAVHHQATEMNVTVGLRSAVTNSLAHLPFFLPLAALGVPTSVFLGVTVLHLVAMTWLHTTKIGTLGALERWLNTPSLHALHHSAAPEHHDKNFGGLLIIYDRLFGTYAAPVPIERYGLEGEQEAPGPVRAHLVPYRDLFSRQHPARCTRASAFLEALLR